MRTDPNTLRYLARLQLNEDAGSAVGQQLRDAALDLEELRTENATLRAIHAALQRDVAALLKHLRVEREG